MGYLILKKMRYALNDWNHKKLIMKQTFSYLWIIVLLTLLSGCNQEKGENLGRYGMLDEGTPEYTAVIFLQSIYEGENVDTAIKVSTESLARIINRYRTNRNVQRHLLNLRYDTVEIKPQSANRVGRSEFAEKATITVFLSGMLEDDKIEDIRSLDLVRENGDWKVARIYPDHFM